jgi:hypothetical protein
MGGLEWRRFDSSGQSQASAQAVDRFGRSRSRTWPVGESVERRNHPRFQTKFDVLCSTGAQEGAGMLVNISRSGACLDLANPLPDLGKQVRLYIFVQPVSPFELAGEVVRHEGSSFAIQYSNLDAEIERLVDDVAAMVSGP